MNYDETGKSKAKLRFFFVRKQFVDIQIHPIISHISLIYYIFFFFYFSGVCLGQQQVFRVTPSDVHVGEGRTAVINCEVENQAGQVQWTKDGLTLGKRKECCIF